MTDNNGIAMSAADELRAAANALIRANALLCVIQHAISTCQTDQLSAYHLAEMATELTGVHAERAEAAADFFAEVCHG
ncbi:hypothetical protein PQR37_34390 [Paraburkholderia nemoris]|uniref:hypothetical protein n=1 Tax=Paraburkholderia TaxID=1822464 RepID=UPI0038BB429B